MPDYALTLRCPHCHGIAELVGVSGVMELDKPPDPPPLVYECSCGERVEEGAASSELSLVVPTALMDDGTVEHDLRVPLGPVPPEWKR